MSGFSFAAPAIGNSHVPTRPSAASSDPIRRAQRFGLTNRVTDSARRVELQLQLDNALVNDDDHDDAALNGDSEALPLVSKEALDDELDQIQRERTAALQATKPLKPPKTTPSFAVFRWS
jgi:hypothetical protein